MATAERLIIRAQAVADPAKRTFKEVTFPAPALGPFEILVKVEACGCCHSDFYALRTVGSVPGHEIVGVVEAVGTSAPDGMGVGARVGMGYQRSACMECDQCRRGDEQLCAKKTTFLQGGPAGYATHVVWDARFAFPIPAAMESTDAGPLLCAGATVYSAFVNNGVEARMRVGVLGIGGLGHLGLQFARALGCHVTALSGSPDKEAEAKSFGAHAFLNTRDPDAVKTYPKMHFILNTVSASIPWDDYVRLLLPNGKLCLVGIPDGGIVIKDPVNFITQQKHLCGSLIANRATMADMLTFASRHGIKPKTELVELSPDGCEQAIKRIDENKARYRIVLVPKL